MNYEDNYTLEDDRRVLIEAGYGYMHAERTMLGETVSDSDVDEEEVESKEEELVIHGFETVRNFEEMFQDNLNDDGYDYTDLALIDDDDLASDDRRQFKLYIRRRLMELAEAWDTTLPPLIEIDDMESFGRLRDGIIDQWKGFMRMSAEYDEEFMDDYLEYLKANVR